MRKIQFALSADGGFVFPDTESMFSEVEIDVPTMLVHAMYSGTKPLTASSRVSTVFSDASVLGFTEVVLDGGTGSGGDPVTDAHIMEIAEQAIADSGIVPIAKFEQNVSFPTHGGSMIITHNRNTLPSSCMLYDNAGTEYSATVTEATVNSFKLTTTKAFTGKIVCSF